jgi:hypothetical protein
MNAHKTTIIAESNAGPGQPPNWRRIARQIAPTIVTRASLRTSLKIRSFMKADRVYRKGCNATIVVRDSAIPNGV